MAGVSHPSQASVTTSLKDEISVEGKDGFLVSMSTAVNDALSGFFQKLGNATGRMPYAFIFGSLLLAGALGSGFANFETETQSENLFVPQGTRSLVDKKDLTEYYGQNTRFISLVIAPKPEDANMLSKKNLLAGLEMINEVLAMEAEGSDKEMYNIEDLCLRVGPGCLVNSVYSSWLYDPARLSSDSDKDIADKLKSIGKETLESFFGGVRYDKDGLPSFAGAQRITAILKNNLTDITPDDNSNRLNDVGAEAWEEKLVSLADATLKNDDRTWDKSLSVYPQSGYSFRAEVGGAIGGDVPIVSASYFIIILYIGFVLNNSCSRVEGSIALTLFSLCTIGLAIVSAFGLSQLLGIKYGNTHTILIFIVLGVGADGCFIMVNAWRRTRADTLSERCGNALAHAGVSLTVSSLTNVAAFGVGSLTVIPDLSSFGKYAALSLFFLWIYLVTFYSACLVLNERRIDGNRVDVFCCVRDCGNKDLEARKERRNGEYKPSRMSRWMKDTYAPFIMKNSVRAIVVFFGLAFVGFCGYMASTLTVEATGSNFLPDDSYLKTNFDIQGELFGGENTRVQVVVQEFDLKNKVELLGMDDKFRFETSETAAPYIVPTFVYWMDNFVNDLEAYAEGSKSANFTVTLSDIPVDTAFKPSRRFPKNEERFYHYLNLWLQEVAGGVRFKRDIVFVDGKIKRARINMEHSPMGEADDDGLFKEDAGEIVKAMDKMYEICDAFTFKVYPYAFEYTDEWSSFKVIGEELFRNAALALACVLVVTLILIGHPITSSVVFFSTCFTIIELLGMNAVIGLKIDTVVTVLVVLTIGISVDYTAHLAYGFMLQQGTRTERITEVLGDVAVPVLNGAISTILAVLLQSVSKSYVFRVVFYEFVLCCTFSIINGLLFVPIVLSLIGPAAYRVRSHK